MTDEKPSEAEERAQREAEQDQEYLNQDAGEGQADSDITIVPNHGAVEEANHRMLFTEPAAELREVAPRPGAEEQAVAKQQEKAPKGRGKA